jgi:hypothetical protein
MKKNTFNTGIEDFALDDLEHAQEGIIEVFREILVMLNLTDVTFRLRGVVTSFGSGTYSWTSGSIYYNGEVYLVDAGTLSTGSTPKWKIVTTLRSGNPVPHQEGGNKDVNVIRKMTLAVDGTIETWNGIPLFSFPAGFSGNYADLSGKPTLFDGAYASLSGKPTLFDGNYNSLSNKPIGDWVDNASLNIYVSEDNYPWASWRVITPDGAYEPITNLSSVVIGKLLEGSIHLSNGNWDGTNAPGAGDVFKAIAIELPQAVVASNNMKGSVSYIFVGGGAHNIENNPPDYNCFWEVGQITVSSVTKNVLIFYRPTTSLFGHGEGFGVKCSFKARLQ